MSPGAGPVRVGFLPPGDSAWMGGVNYFCNLLSTLAEHGGGRYESVVLVGCRADEATVSRYARHAQVVRHPVLDAGTPSALLRGVLKRLGLPTPLGRLLRRLRIDVVSHVTGEVSDIPCPVSGWIPDFQHRALPQLFTPQALAVRDRDYAKLCRLPDLLVLSSESAGTDALAMEGCRPERIRVLRFPSPENPPPLEAAELEALRALHGLPVRYLHLPNQFWRHKNHRTAFRALREALALEPSLTLACTGNLDADKDPDYAREIEVELEGLGPAVRRLGVVPYREMLGIMQGAVAVLQPSRFEGWSTSVEEARQMRKRLLLSDLPVHREQDVPGAHYFAPEDASGLAGLLVRCWRGELPAVPDEAFEAGRITRADFFASFDAILRELAGVA